MPNWCSNNLHVSGDAEVLETFVNTLGLEGEVEGKGLFDNIVAMPAELKDAPASSNAEVAYELWFGDFETAKSKISAYQADKLGKSLDDISIDELKAALLADEPKLEEWANLYNSNIKKYGYPTWYEWANNTWGTKWNPEIQDFYDDEGTYASITFDSAWGPPARGICAMSKEWPELSFKLEYREEGMDFEGVVEYKAGATLEEAEWSYSSSYSPETVTISSIKVLAKGKKWKFKGQAYGVNPQEAREANASKILTQFSGIIKKVKKSEDWSYFEFDEFSFSHGDDFDIENMWESAVQAAVEEAINNLE